MKSLRLIKSANCNTRIMLEQVSVAGRVCHRYVTNPDLVEEKEVLLREWPSPRSACTVRREKLSNRRITHAKHDERREATGASHMLQLPAKR
jgi:hypothetical protein